MTNKVLQLDISKAISICLRKGIKVYPVVSNKKFKIEVNDNGKLKRYNKEVVASELNKALSNTYKHYAVIILKDKEDASSTIKSKQKLGKRI